MATELGVRKVFMKVSMKSGLEDRNNQWIGRNPVWSHIRLNEVRPGRPEQCGHGCKQPRSPLQRLNEVRPGRPEQ